MQVRYSRDNPADSIVVAETWNVLWTNIRHWSGSRLTPSGNRRAQAAEQAAKVSSQPESLKSEQRTGALVVQTSYPGWHTL